MAGDDEFSRIARPSAIPPGCRLFEALKAWFRERGASHVSLRVAVTNPVSQTFWRNVGCEDYMAHMWCPL